ncbi:MAG TPA: methionine ABC transporter ATP-binding protein [Selenomonadales bacterium]|nr:methionine ABC transporter ATP-binding protein [Selenomonadales bacterium]
MIEIHNLQKSYNGVTILKDINLTIQDGEIYGLVGRSGAGKSTLLRCINGLESYDSGSLKVDRFDIKQHNENEIRHFRKNIGMIFQHFSLMERKTVYQNVALPMKCWGYSRTDTDKRVRELLKVVELEEKINDKPRMLSGGQKQRVAIARALSLNPKILLCDEATSALDPKTTQSILALLEKINKTFHIAVVIVTHQMSVVRKICHKVSILENGKISASGTVSKVFLEQPQSLKNLLGEEEDELILGGGKTIKITYAESGDNNRILSDMARELNVGFSLSGAKLERYRDAVLGAIVLTVDDERIADIGQYLTERGVSWEVLSND